MTALSRRSTLPDGLVAAGAGAMLGGLALAPQVHAKTITELAIAAVVLALTCTIVGNPRRFLLAALVLDIPLEWGKNLFYQADVATKFGALGGLNISGTTIALTGLYIMWAFGRRARAGAAPRVVLVPALPLIVYLAVNILSLLAARSKALGEYEIAMLTETLLLFIYIASNIRSRADVRFLVTAALAGLALESVVILFVYGTGHTFHFLGIGNRVDPGTYGGRVGGTVGSPNAAAAYLCLLLPVAMAMLAAPITGRMRRLALAGLPLGVVALVVTGSRGGWISFAISVTVLVVWAVRQHLLALRTALVTVLGVTALIVPFWGQISHRVSGNDQGSAHSRVAMSKLASEMISAHPLLGLGVNNVGINVPNYAGPEFDGQFIYTIHDKYLLVWAEAGVGALLALLWFILSTLRRGLRCVRSRDPLLAPLSAGLIAGVTGQLVHMAVDIFQSKPQVEGLWFTAALLVSIELILRRERRVQTVTSSPRRDTPRRLDHFAARGRTPLRQRAGLL